MKGFHNKLLRVNLADREWRVEEIPDAVFEKYLGGKGLAAYLMLKETPAGLDPFAPASPIIFATGPAADSLLAPASRYVVVAKSPLTGVLGHSYSGGSVAPVMKATGCDAVVLTGASDSPVWLEISGEGVRFHDASDLWGQSAYRSEKAIREASGDKKAKAVVIGPAGENMVRFAALCNDTWRKAGRTGMGAVLGSKKVKGLLFRGNKKTELFDPDGVTAFRKEFLKKNKDNAGVKAYNSIGTPMVVALAHKFDSFPSYNWTAGRVEHWETISGDYMREVFEPRSKGCTGCFIACGKLLKVPGGEHAGLELEGPEYETIAVLGGLCGVQELSDVVYLNDICDELGLDTISMGNVVGFAIEAAKRGKLDIEIDYGDVDAIADLIRKVAAREGAGKLLAEGVKIASEELGLEEIAVHVKGLEPPGYEPRALKGMGLAFAVSDRGACHLRATVYKAEFAGWTEPQSTERKAETVLDFEDRHTIYDTLIFCRFYRDIIGWDELSVVVRLLTGLELDKKGLQELSARVAHTVRTYNLREGMTPEADTLPPRLLEEPLPTGQRLTREELEGMVREYYALRGWSEEGLPPVVNPA